MLNRITKSYTELLTFETLEERFEYLSLQGIVGEETFGTERWVNQKFYRSSEWRRVRDEVITRDLGMDLAVSDIPVRGAPRIHHMNPIRIEDFDENPESLIDPEFLITTSLKTHNAIHFGDASMIPKPYIPRQPGDTTLWRADV